MVIDSEIGITENRQRVWDDCSLFDKTKIAPGSVFAFTPFDSLRMMNCLLITIYQMNNY